MSEKKSDRWPTEREEIKRSDSRSNHTTSERSSHSRHSRYDNEEDRERVHHTSNNHHTSSNRYSSYQSSSSKRHRSDYEKSNGEKRPKSSHERRDHDHRHRSSREADYHQILKHGHIGGGLIENKYKSKGSEYTCSKETRDSSLRGQLSPEMAGEWVINEDDSSSDEEVSPPEKKISVPNPNRDAWMNDESFDFLAHTSEREFKLSRKEQEAVHRSRKREEENLQIQKDMEKFEVKEANENDMNHEVSYTFGGPGSDWRMMKLNKTYEAAKEQNLPVNDLALLRYGSLKLFDDAREEKYELTRRMRAGVNDNATVEKPTGRLFKARSLNAGGNTQDKDKLNENETAKIISTSSPLLKSVKAPDYTKLNKLKADVMKAKLKNDKNYEELQETYEKELKKSQASISDLSSVSEKENENNIKILSSMDARILNVSSKSEEDMTVEELAAEERRLNAISGSSNRATMQNIGKDKSFSTDLDYMEENSSNLAKYIKKGDIDLKNIAISQVKKMEKILDNCPLCMENGKSANTPIIAIGTKVYLTIPPQPELAKYSATIVPITHHNNTLMCEEDEWDEIRNFMSCLAKMYHSLGKGVIFYENAVSPHKNGHAVIEAVPIPLDLSNSAPAFFKDAILTSDEEWSQHLKIIDTGKRAREGAGRYAFKTSIAQEAPYFHVWFTLDGGYGHIVEDSNKWPRGDLFAREVIGGMMRLEPHIIKKQGRWRCNIDDPQVMEFEQKWENFDWTIEKNKQL